MIMKSNFPDFQGGKPSLDALRRSNRLSSLFLPDDQFSSLNYYFFLLLALSDGKEIKFTLCHAQFYFFANFKRGEVDVSKKKVCISTASEKRDCDEQN